MAELTESSLKDFLWQGALTSAGVPIHSGCEQHLRDFIAYGVRRMVIEDRISRSDVLLASASLFQFIAQMKHQASVLGHPEYLGEDSFGEAVKSISQMVGKNRLDILPSGFVLWPFWPPPWMQ